MAAVPNTSGLPTSIGNSRGAHLRINGQALLTLYPPKGVLVIWNGCRSNQYCWSKWPVNSLRQPHGISEGDDGQVLWSGLRYATSFVALPLFVAFPIGVYQELTDHRDKLGAAQRWSRVWVDNYERSTHRNPLWSSDDLDTVVVTLARVRPIF